MWARRSSQQLNPERWGHPDVRLAVMGAFIAGMDTAANSLAFVLYRMHRHPCHHRHHRAARPVRAVPRPRALRPGLHSQSRAFKAERYRELPSLQAYLLVDSRSRGAAIWRREGSEWTFDLPCPTVTLNLADFYDGTQL